MKQCAVTVEVLKEHADKHGMPATEVGKLAQSAHSLFVWEFIFDGPAQIPFPVTFKTLLQVPPGSQTKPYLMSHVCLNPWWSTLC